MKVKGSLYWIYSFISGCKGKMLVAILLAVIGVLCGMAPYFALAGILSGLIQNTLTAERIFCYVGIAVLGETLKMLFNTVSSLKAHRVAYHILVLDPRTKILLLLGINIFVFTNSHVYAEMLVVAALVILLLLCGVYKTALKSTITYIVLLAIKCWILPFCPEIIMTSLNIVVITFRKLLPCVTLGALLVQTTPIRLLMHAMQKWHLPQAVIIPLAITVRYFPTLHEEQQAISDAMKLRNVHGVFQKLEYIYVPLMLSASTTADELSQAITARGIDNPRPKTCAVSMRFHIQDYVLCFVAIVLVISAFVLL